MAYIERALTPLILQGLKDSPAVFINGPRQAGKSTLVRQVMKAQPGAAYMTFDDLSTQAAAKNDPEAFLRRAKSPLILDEVQLVPEVFRALKLVIDEKRHTDPERANGNFLLTGSTNVMLLPALSDSLVGRMQILTLLTLSMREVMKNPENLIDQLFADDLRFKSASKPIPDQGIYDIMAASTYPGITTHPHLNQDRWFESYLTTLVQRDIKALFNIEKISAFPNLLKIIAARAGGLLNDADCARDAGLNLMTYRRYRLLLQNIFLTFTVAPWHRNIGKRLVKSPKLFMTDTALLCHLLGAKISQLKENNSHFFGHVLENFVAAELSKHLTLMTDGQLYHFRTHDNKKVDFVIERRNGNLIGIEVKAKASLNSKDFSSLQVLKEKVGKDFVRGVVLYLGHQVIPFADDLTAVPLQALA